MSQIQIPKANQVFFFYIILLLLGKLLIKGLTTALSEKAKNAYSTCLEVGAVLLVGGVETGGAWEQTYRNNKLHFKLHNILAIY